MTPRSAVANPLAWATILSALPGHYAAAGSHSIAATAAADAPPPPANEVPYFAKPMAARGQVLRGIVVDAATNKAIEYALIIIDENMNSHCVNPDGTFELGIPAYPQ